jgi:hypothetical protein
MASAVVASVAKTAPCRAGNVCPVGPGTMAAWTRKSFPFFTSRTLRRRSSGTSAWASPRRWEHRFEPGLPAFVEVARGRVRLFLSEHEGDARPDTLVYLRVRDVDAIAAEFGVRAQDAPWAREIELRDPDGNRLRIGTPTA